MKDLIPLTIGAILGGRMMADQRERIARSMNAIDAMEKNDE